MLEIIASARMLEFNVHRRVRDGAARLHVAPPTDMHPTCTKARATATRYSQMNEMVIWTIYPEVHSMVHRRSIPKIRLYTSLLREA